MSAYNKTAVTSALYDYTGTPSDQHIGDGTPLCMCFSLGGAQGRMDMCMDILEDATPECRWIWAYDDIAGGTFIWNSRKALPQCSEVNVKAISSSVYAGLEADTTITDPPSADATSNVIGDRTTGRQTKTSAVWTPNNSGETSTEVADDNDTGDKGDKIALGVGLGMGIPTILLTAAGLYVYRYRGPIRARLGIREDGQRAQQMRPVELSGQDTPTKYS
ncbi:MAG: hypothetical protein Q9176_004055 [Flavoplaca citrina]